MALQLLYFFLFLFLFLFKKLSRFVSSHDQMPVFQYFYHQLKFSLLFLNGYPILLLLNQLHSLCYCDFFLFFHQLFILFPQLFLFLAICRHFFLEFLDESLLQFRQFVYLDCIFAINQLYLVFNSAQSSYLFLIIDCYCIPRLKINRQFAQKLFGQFLHNLFFRMMKFLILSLKARVVILDLPQTERLPPFRKILYQRLFDFIPGMTANDLLLFHYLIAISNQQTTLPHRDYHNSNNSSLNNYHQHIFLLIFIGHT